MSDKKFCPHCESFKDTSEFHKNVSTKDKLSYWCKDCNKTWAASKHKNKHYGQPAKVYLFRNIDTGMCYVGRTTQSLDKRRWGHKTDAFSKYSTMRVHQLMRMYPNDSQWEMSVLEQLPYDADRDEQREAEQRWIDQLAPALNTRNEIREDG